MHAITYRTFGAAKDVLTLEDMPTPTPAAGEVLVRIETSAVNPSDVRARAGGRPGVTKPPFPVIIPHSDGAGVIEAVGDGIDQTRIGERVWLWNAQWQRPFGTAADYIALPAGQAVPLPENVSFDEGAVLGIPGLTAVHTVLGGGPVAGKTLLISGGAGSVGRLAVQIASASGARVLATCSAEDIEDTKAAGATHAFNYNSENLADQILSTTDGQLIDRIVEVEFGKNIATNTAVIAPNGTLVAYGSAKDMTPTLPFYPLMFKAVTLDLALIYLLSPAARTRATNALTDLLTQNALDIRIADRLPLSQTAKAHEIVENGTRKGAVLLHP